jgi:PPE-repeat protein
MLMLDFGTLPPEVTSARMYAGPGSGPMMAAAAAWDALAVQLDSVSRDYSSVISSLQGENWSGPASVAMADAAAPYAEWATTTGAQAEHAASQARAAAAAYEAAYAATVPPALVTANRTQLAHLVTTNTFGQNTTEIAATEADYADMWAQDAHAMYGYATDSSAATKLTPFSESPPTTNAAGQSAQSAAVAHAAATAADSQLAQQMSVVPQNLQTLSTAGASNPPADPLASALTQFDAVNTLNGPAGFAEANSRTVTSAGSFLSGIYRSILQSQGAVAKALPEPPPATTGAVMPDSGGVRGAVLASASQAEPIGGLSVPQRWAEATPAPTAFAESPWLSETELAAASSWEAAPATSVAGAESTTGMGPMAGMSPLTGMGSTSGGGRPTVSNILRVEPRRFSMPRPALGG